MRVFRDPDTAMGGEANGFPSTRGSLMEAVAGDGSVAEEALGAVAELYWKPVYRWVRFRFGMGNEEAKDLTQGFFALAIERGFFRNFDPGRASFRTYLRMAVERFAAKEYEAAGRLKRGGGATLVAEECAEVAGGASPEEVFEREWRRQVFALGIEDLRRHTETAGKAVQWGVFEAYDLAEGERPSYGDLAARFGIAETSVTNYLAWARRTLRGFVAARLRGVTGGEREMREELRRLWN
jgi:RNA polymerase sigma-70 factor (ECF subfamily)